MRGEVLGAVIRFGAIPVSKRTGIRSEIGWGYLYFLYNEDEVGSVVRIGCCTSGSPPIAISGTEETVSRPIHRKTAHLWFCRRCYAMERISAAITID